MTRSSGSGIWTAVIAALAAVACAALAARGSDPLQAFSEAEIAAARALSPERPEGYLELGEEILDRPDAPERIELARQLLVRAVEYGRLRKGGEETAASAALAIASIAPNASQRQWLRAVAAILHPDYRAMRPGDRVDAATGARAAEVVTRLRGGEGIRPRELMADPAVRAALKQNEPGLSTDGTIGVSDLDAAAKKQPCTTCGGRFLAMPQGPRSAVLCPSCKGRPVIMISRQDFASQVRTQLHLLGTPRDRWGDQTDAEMLPARDPDAAEVAVVFGVDTKLSVWRDGRWQEPLKPSDEEGTDDSKRPPPTVAPAR